MKPHSMMNQFFVPYARLGILDAWRKLRHGDDDVISQFLRDGFVRFSDFLDPETCAEMLAVVPSFEAMEKSPESVSRIARHLGDKPSFSPFYKSERLTGWVHKLLGSNTHLLRTSAERRELHGYTGSFSEFFHCDTWRYRVRAILYLNDVGTDNGPFIYVPRSQRGLWRFPLDRELFELYDNTPDTYEHSFEKQFGGAFFPHQSERLFRRKKFQPVEMTGKTGTLILFDGRGLHRAKPLVNGTRVSLSAYWVEAGRHN